MDEEIKDLKSGEQSNQPGQSGQPWNKNILILSVAILMAALIVGGSVLYIGQVGFANIFGSASNTPTPNNVVNAKDLIGNAVVLGGKKAPVTIIDFSDFQCPYCRIFWENTFSQLKKDYIDTGRVSFVLKDFPLSFHPGALPAAKGAMCANDQGKYWDMVNKIFSEQAKQGQGTVQFTIDDVKKWASQIGLDVAKFNSCVDSNKYQTKIDQDNAEGTKLGVEGTPTFFINSTQLVGAQPYTEFKKIIDAELLKNK